MSKQPRDSESAKHEDYCFIHVIPAPQRTLYSCNCSERQAYKARFPLKRDDDASHQADGDRANG